MIEFVLLCCLYSMSVFVGCIPAPHLDNAKGRRTDRRTDDGVFFRAGVETHLRPLDWFHHCCGEKRRFHATKTQHVERGIARLICAEDDRSRNEQEARTASKVRLVFDEQCWPISLQDSFLRAGWSNGSLFAF